MSEVYNIVTIKLSLHLLDIKTNHTINVLFDLQSLLPGSSLKHSLLFCLLKIKCKLWKIS